SFHGLETDLPFCQPPGLPLTASTLQLSLGWSPTPFFMVSLLCCVPKLTTCGIVLSAWGVPMLIMLGIFFNVHSAVLIETFPSWRKILKTGLRTYTTFMSKSATTASSPRAFTSSWEASLSSSAQ
uniref:Uncharacterized protein n=1 Tax=Castor canadensis TaxID=51338 RepID=A0A8C0XDM0_CASCN